MSNWQDRDNDKKAPPPPIVMPKIESAIETSATIGALAAALAKTQAEMRGAIKDAQNPHLKNKYADLASAWAAWQPHGPKNGLAIVQLPGTVSDGTNVTVTIVTMLTHSSGEWIRGTLAMPVKAERGRSDAQALGSAVTYGRRYGMMAVCGLAAEDDDGNGAGSNAYRNEPPPRTNGNAPSREPSVELTDARRMIANAKNVDDMDRCKAWIQQHMPNDHPDRGTAVREWSARDKEIAAAQPRAS